MKARQVAVLVIGCVIPVMGTSGQQDLHPAVACGAPAPLGINNGATKVIRRQTAGQQAELLGQTFETFGVYFKDKRWPKGHVVRVKFMDGNMSLQQRVREIAEQWTVDTNLKFDFSPNDEGEVRVSFDLEKVGQGVWSEIGIDAAAVDRTRPTMGLNWLAEHLMSSDFNGIVLHEFGHVLGALHEHQSPAAGIKWHEEEVYKYYGDTYGWGRPVVRKQVLTALSRDVTVFSAFDPRSVMLYAIPAGLAENFEQGWNGALSTTDREYAAEQYPKN